MAGARAKTSAGLASPVLALLPTVDARCRPSYRHVIFDPTRTKRKSASVRSETGDTVSNAGLKSAQSPKFKRGRNNLRRATFVQGAPEWPQNGRQRLRLS
jgi:hypothetical protein